MVINTVSTWNLSNSSPIGGPGKIVEVHEAKFFKKMVNGGSYREGIWVLGGLDRVTGPICRREATLAFLSSSPSRCLRSLLSVNKVPCKQLLVLLPVRK